MEPTLISFILRQFYRDILIELNKKAGEPRAGWLAMNLGLCRNLCNWIEFNGLEDYLNPLYQAQSESFGERAIIPFNEDYREYQSEKSYCIIFANQKRLEFIKKMANGPINS